MSYTFVYEPDYSRILPALIIDARASIPEIANQVGFVIKAYCDSKLALITDNCIAYKLETELGVIAGMFVIEVDIYNKTAKLQQQVFRPAFQGFTEIPILIGNFIQNNFWQPYFLF